MSKNQKKNKYSVTPEIWFTNKYRKQSNFLLPHGLGGKANCFLLLPACRRWSPGSEVLVLHCKWISRSVGI